MARPLRLELPGGIYHVTARGNERRSIFREAIARAHRKDDYSMRKIAGALGCHYATISRRLRAFEKDGVS
jgi:transposase